MYLYQCDNLVCTHCTGAIPMSTGLFGRGNATILVRDFGCTGREQSLQQCTPSNYSISSYYSYGFYVYNQYVQSAKHFLLHMILASFSAPHFFLLYAIYPLSFWFFICSQVWEQGYDLLDADIWRIFVTLFKMHEAKLLHSLYGGQSLHCCRNMAV